MALERQDLFVGTRAEDSPLPTSLLRPTAEGWPTAISCSLARPNSKCGGKTGGAPAAHIRLSCAEEHVIVPSYNADVF